MSLLDRAVIAVSTRDVVAHECAMSMARCARLGAALSTPIRGIPSLALARNTALTVALKTEREFIVCIDDDMTFEPADVETLLAASKADGLAHAACYVGVDGQLMATRHLGSANRWLAGLGCCVFPRALLMSVAESLGTVRSLLGPIIPFCHDAPRNGHWCFDDYWLCYTLDGVVLEPVIVGHLKTIELKPNLDQVKALLEQA